MKCEEANPHGGGVAWVEGDLVRWQKGLKAAKIAEMIADKTITLPAMIHFRIATSGGVRDELCHPFPISNNASTDLQGRAKMALIHNGHWTDWGSKVLSRVIKEGKKVKGHWSDSRALAWLAARFGEAVFELAGDQKICTLDSEGHLVMYGNWPGDDKDGLWYSNTIWKYRGSGSYSYGFREWDDEEWQKRWGGSKDRKGVKGTYGDKEKNIAVTVYPQPGDVGVWTKTNQGWIRTDLEDETIDIRADLLDSVHE